MYSLFIVCVIDVILYVVLVGNYFNDVCSKTKPFWEMLPLDNDKGSNVIVFSQTIAHVFWLIITLCMLAEILSSSYGCPSADTCMQKLKQHIF